MARTKRQVKAKEPIKIRFKKLANGNKSIYLDIYTDGRREYEFLKLYLVPEKNEAARVLNQNALQAANAIKSQMIIDLANGKARINKSRCKILLSDWILMYGDKLGEKYKYHFKALRTIVDAVCAKTGKKTLSEIDKRYCLAFVDYLRHGYIGRLGKPLSRTTASNYCTFLKSALNMAVREELINNNPYVLLDVKDRIVRGECERVYLTIEEIKKLIAADVPSRTNTTCQIKEPFLFACFTGFRYSDVKALTWERINKDGNKFRLIINQKKTKETNSIELSAQAQKWMPKRGCKSNDDLVFSLPTEPHMNNKLKMWAKAAGIEKNISFHTARHSFATMMLTLGVDLYTVSKLLGHTNISNTQIYAKIVDKKKDEAVNLVNDVF